MKGVKKCYGLLLALFIMVGLSLSVCSADTNALKYSFDSFPLYRAVYSDTSAPSGENFGFWFDSTDLPVFRSNLSDLDISYKYAPLGTYPDCSNSSSKSQIFSQYDISARNYKSIWSGEGNGFQRSFGVNSCFENVTSYSYDSFYGSTYKTSTGDVEKVVNIDNILFNSPGSRFLKRVTIPLNFSENSTFPANTPMTFSFSLTTTRVFGFSDFTTPNVSFDVYYASNGQSFHDAVSTCSIDSNYGFLLVNPDLSVESSLEGFNVSCTYTPSVPVSHFTSRLILYGGSSDINPSSFLSYTSSEGLFFGASYLVTDNDDTWSGISISPTPSGENIAFAPGYSQLYGSSSPCSPGDWLCDLTNLFNFSFINPFAGIFNLFNNDSCANIPTLAGMLHSNTSTVCPWFNSTTRNILTPVLGLSAMMLVFGFTVRWLGARSGNFIEDSGGVDSGGYHFENKYRRSKK